MSGKPPLCGVYVSPHFNFHNGGKTARKPQVSGSRSPSERHPETDGASVSAANIAMPRSEPDSGNPTVRDRREACGNISYGSRTEDYWKTSR